MAGFTLCSAAIGLSGHVGPIIAFRVQGLSGALIGGLFFITFRLQNVHGTGPAEADRYLLPLTTIMIVTSPPAGHLIARLGPRLPMLAGMLIASAASWSDREAATSTTKLRLTG